MRNTATAVQERNREMGRLLQEARTRKRIPAAACAEKVGTSRRRYADMEDGTALIGAAELAVLSEFLEIPVQRIWPGACGVGGGQQVVVQAQRGETLQITVVPG